MPPGPIARQRPAPVPQHRLFARPMEPPSGFFENGSYYSSILTKGLHGVLRCFRQTQAFAPCVQPSDEVAEN